jgi:hypothetical protein
MKHGVFFGGNLRLWPWTSLYASENSDIAKGLVKYAAHLAQRDFTLHQHYDGASGNWASWARQQLPTGKVEVGDSLRLIMFGRGARLRNLVFHNRNAVAGTTLEVQAFTHDGTAIGAALTINAAQADKYHELALDDQPITAKAGYIEVKLVAGTLPTACFDVYLTLTNYVTDMGCSCADEPCDVEVPEPNCVPFYSGP